MLDTLLLESGANLPVLTMETTLSQPTLREIALFGEAGFSDALSIFNIDKKSHEKDVMESKKYTDEEKETVKNELLFMTEFQFTLVAVENQKLLPTLKGFFFLIFPNARNIVIEDSFVSISFSDKEQAVLLTDEKFEELRTIVRQMFMMDKAGRKAFNPANDEAAKIAKKLEERHKRLAAEKGEKKEGSIIATNASILSTLSGIPLKDIYDYTYLQLVHQLERSEKLIGYETQISLGAFGGLKDVEISDFREPIV